MTQDFAARIDQAIDTLVDVAGELDAIATRLCGLAYQVLDATGAFAEPLHRKALQLANALLEREKIDARVAGLPRRLHALHELARTRAHAMRNRAINLDATSSTSADEEAATLAIATARGLKRDLEDLEQHALLVLGS